MIARGARLDGAAGVSALAAGVSDKFCEAADTAAMIEAAMRGLQEALSVKTLRSIHGESA